MLRDSVHRAYKPEQTLLHWHICPFFRKEKYFTLCNSAIYCYTSMPYEVPLYAAKFKNDFADWEKKYADDPLREDAYTRASELKSFRSN